MSGNASPMAAPDSPPGFRQWLDKALKNRAR
jgi:hypothetical protein